MRRLSPLLASLFAGLSIILGTAAGALTTVGAFDAPGFAYDLEVVGDLAYLADGYSGLRIIACGPECADPIRIDLDIKPGSDPNTIHRANRGVIPVALLGADTFDVVDVDATTLAFGPDGAAPAHDQGPHVEDVNADGLLDLVAHFRTEQTGIASGATLACLSGKTLDSSRFEGCDAVRTVSAMDHDAVLDVDAAARGIRP